MSRTDRSWNGATLAERLAHVRGDEGRSKEGRSKERPLPKLIPERSVADGSLDAWARAASLGNLDSLIRRLSWDGIDVPVAREAMAATAPGDFPVAPWVDRLADFVAEARACATETRAAGWEDEIASAGDDSPFADVWIPVLRAARRTLHRAVPLVHDWLSDESRLALDRQLIKELSTLGELALLQDFRAGFDSSQPERNQRYRSYIEHLLASRYDDIFEAFPVLGRHAVLVAEQWVEHIAALCHRVQQDGEAIESTFGRPAGPIRRLTPGLSDRHEGGCRVALVEFASGLRLAYKPRDIRLEKAFNDAVQWLRDAGLTALPRPLRIADRGTYGWVEWVEQEELHSIDAVRRYFRAAGSLVCLAHVLGATDLHSENLIATSAGPAVLDAEMLVQPSTRRFTEDDDFDGRPLQSCLSSGIVSAIVLDNSGTAFDVGGLRPAVSRGLAVPMRRWLDLRSDAVRFVAVDRIRPTLKNDVRLNAEVQKPEDFADELCAGFESAHRFLEANRTKLLADDGPLAGFAACRARVLFRPSDRYSTAQYVLASPRFQRRGLDRSLALETFDRVFAHERERPRLWPLVHDERQALEALDIPRQTIPATSTDLQASGGEVVHAFYAQSGLDAMRGRVTTLSAADRAYQIDELRAALGCMAVDLASPPNHRGEGELRAAAERIATVLLSRATRSAEGRLTWLSSSGRTDLYAGSSGIGLFFAALARVTGDRQWRDVALMALPDDGTGMMPASAAHQIGICSGRPSRAYASALAGHLLADEGLHATAHTIMATIPSEAVDADTVLDIEGGAAGTLVACLALLDVTFDDRLIALAKRCVSRLQSMQIRSGPDRGAWPSGDDGRARPGFAHGAAGIAYALGRAAAHLDDPALIDPVREAWAYERRIFDRERAWPAVRPDGGQVAMVSWCHGAPGIALARAAAPAGMADADLVAELEAAMGQTLAAPAAQLDHLCCGNLGRADAALTAGLRTGNTAWIDRGVSTSKAVAARILAEGRLGMRGKGFHRGAPIPEFFQGLAGIGYQLLRASAPSVIPSVLVFDAH